MTEREFGFIMGIGFMLAYRMLGTVVDQAGDWWIDRQSRKPRKKSRWWHHLV